MLEYAAVAAGATDPDNDVCAEPEGPRIWPEWPDGCPCSGAFTTSSAFYRLTDPSDPNDWVPQGVWRDETWFANLRDDDTRCRALSISIFSTVDAVRQTRNRIGRFRGHAIIEIRVEPDMGVVEEGSHDHFSWWPSESVKPPLQGRVVA